MMVGDICKRQVITLHEQDLVREAAQMMKDKEVGDVIVVDEAQHPVGIITDRDIMIKVVVEDADIETAKVSDLMSQNILMLAASQPFQEAVDRMEEKGVRRAPVIDEQQKLYGIVTLDDLLVKLSEWLSKLAELVEKQHVQAGV